jgi:hypothetical protein
MPTALRRQQDDRADADQKIRGSSGVGSLIEPTWLTRSHFACA